MESRIIKFRAWDVECQCMVTDFAAPIGDTLLDRMTGLDDKGQLFVMSEGSPSEYVLMQFTGLHDKNGVEIYEGDVVQIDGTTWVVSWNYGCFIVTVWNNSAAVATINQFRVPEQFEILGNVFSNPELVSE